MLRIRLIRRLAGIWIVFLLFGGMTEVGAQETAIGKVIAIRGQATAQNTDGLRSLPLGGEIGRNDLIQTGCRCRLQIMFADNTIVSLGPDSEFIVKEYAWDAETRQGKMTSQVNEGVFRVLGGSITKSSPDKFITETPGATIGIRGSMYAGSVRDGLLQVVFQGGRGIFVRNELGMVEIDTPGFGTRVEQGRQAPTAPFRFAPADLQQLEPLSAATPTVGEEPPPPGEEGALPPGEEPLTLDAPPPPDDQQPLLTDRPLLPGPLPLPVDSPQQQVAMEQLVVADMPTLPANMPTNGISKFIGSVSGSLTGVAVPNFETISDSIELLVNWHNGKVLGVIAEPGGHTVGYVLGDVSGSGFTTSLFFGNDVTDTAGPGPILAISGSSNLGQFTGEQAQGVYFDFSGSTHTVEPQPQTLYENWQLSGSAVRPDTIKGASTGSVAWKGYAVGVGENMAAIDVGRRLFYTSNIGDFNLSTNRDTGTVSGSLTAMDVASSAQINNLKIGGANPSAYISDAFFAAGVGGGSPIVYGSSGPLKTYGNYLVTKNPADQLASYVTWGYWEIAYVDPGNSGNYHVHIPGAGWVAGELTSPSELGALNFTATYNGRAEGVYVPSVGQYFDMPTGSVTLNVDFSASAVTGGALNFPAGNGAPAVALGIDPTSISSGEFNAAVSMPNSGSVNGAFFGPNAASVGGDFQAQVGSADVIGIFGGDR